MKHAILCLLLFCLTLNLVGNPTGGVVASGNVNMSTAGSSTNINMLSDKAIINWQDFSIAVGETVNFNLPTNDSTVLNRVVTNNISTIAGNLNSNGNVMLINPNGIIVTKSGVINVNNFLGSTLNIKDDDFLNNNLNFVGNSGNIVNNGTINAGGSVILIAKEIDNKGNLNSDNVYLKEHKSPDSVKVSVVNESVNDLIALKNNNIYALAINTNNISRGNTVIQRNGQTYIVSQRGNSGVYESNNESFANSVGLSRVGKSNNYKLNDIPSDTTPNNSTKKARAVNTSLPTITTTPSRGYKKTQLSSDTPKPVIAVMPLTPAHHNPTITPVTIQHHTHLTQDINSHISLSRNGGEVHPTSAPKLPVKDAVHDYNTYYRSKTAIAPVNNANHDYIVTTRNAKNIGVNIITKYSYTDYLKQHDESRVDDLNHFVNLQ